MRRLLSILPIILISIASFSQDGVFTRVIAKQTVFIRDRWIDSVRNDTAGWLGRTRSIGTLDAIYKFVQGRVNAIGTVTNVSLTTNQGLSAVVLTPTTTPDIIITLGDLTGVTSINGLIITPNTGIVTTGIWNGAVIGTAYGGTPTAGTTGQALVKNSNTDFDYSWATIAASGEVNTASNLGGGLPNYDSKLGVDLQFNSFSSSEFNLINNVFSIDYVNGQAASGLNNGFLSSGDWTNFNNKLSSIDTSNITNFYLKVRSLLSAGSGISYDNATGIISATGGGGTVTSVAALTLGTTGTDLSSSVANGTTTPVITLNVPTASASNRGALSAADWSTFNSKLSSVDTTNITNFSGKVRSLFSGTAPIVFTAGVISITQSTTSTNGYLSSTDWNTFNGKGVGTVTTVSVVTANGVSGSVATATTTPAITLTLGAITPTTVNGNTITTGTGVLTLGAGKTFTASNTITLTATDGSTLAIGTGGTLGTNAYTSTAYAPLASPTFTGTPTLPTGTIGVTQSAGNSTTALATTSFVTTADNLKANIASPTFTGTVTIPTPFTIGAVSMTATGTQLNYLNAATGTTGTASTNVVFSTSPTIVTPQITTGLGVNAASISQLYLSGGYSSASTFSVAGFGINQPAGTFTSTTSSGTIAAAAINSIAQPTITASSATTLTKVATLYIAAAPLAGTNVTITQALALQVVAGFSSLEAGFSSNGNTVNSNLYVAGGAAGTNQTNANILFGGASTVNAKVFAGSSSSSSIPTGNSATNVVIGTTPFTTAATGTHNIFASLVVNPTGVITAGGAALTKTATLYINGAGSGGTNNYAIDVVGAGTNTSAFSVDNSGFVSVGSGITPTTELTVMSTSASDPKGIMSAQYTTDAIGARIHFRKSRGTFGSPTIIVTADVLGRLRFSGYDGAAFLQMGSIDVVSTGTIGTNRVPTYMTFSTATNAATSVLTEAMRIDESQNVRIVGNATQAGQIRLYEDTDDGTNYSAFRVGTQSADLTYTLPTAFVAGGALTDVAGNGVLSWTPSTVYTGTNGITLTGTNFTLEGSLTNSVTTLSGHDTKSVTFDSIDAFNIKRSGATRFNLSSSSSIIRSPDQFSTFTAANAGIEIASQTTGSITLLTGGGPLLLQVDSNALTPVRKYSILAITDTSVISSTLGKSEWQSPSQYAAILQPYLTAGGSGLTVGTSTITSGTTTRILYDNAGVLGEYTITGTGTVVAMQTSPAFTTPSLGAATATSINKLTITAPATSSILTIADGSSLITSGAFAITLTSTATTNVTLPTTGTLLSTASFVDNETPSGSVNGSNVTFTLANTPTAGSVKLYLNGLRQQSGGGNDYTISGLTITMAVAPDAGEILIADYRK